MLFNLHQHVLNLMNKIILDIVNDKNNLMTFLK